MVAKNKRQSEPDKNITNRFKLIVFFLFSWLLAIIISQSFISLGISHLRVVGFGLTIFSIYFLAFIGILFLRSNTKKKAKIYIPISSKALKITEFLYSTKNQIEVFTPIVADWEEEYFQALKLKKLFKARWINIRYTFYLLVTMWQKSPIGDLIQFVIKIAKG
ncbi:MAG: hypothetical protein LUM44_16015 [Pyrinomonadaceae bacterium]|nr:hypothetical protein [Pyrinomonadaceae bacterium]